jgi:hypothetical protein
MKRYQKINAGTLVTRIKIKTPSTLPTFAAVDPFSALARQYIGTFVLHGDDNERIRAELDKPLPGITVNKQYSDHEGISQRAVSNIDGIADIVATLMQGQTISREQIGILRRHESWLTLPVDLRTFAVIYFNLGTYYGRPDDLRNRFEELYMVLVHPVFEARLRQLGLDSQALHEQMHKHPEIDPVEALWVLTGLMPVVEADTIRSVRILPTVKMFTETVLAPLLPPEHDPTAFLLGYRDAEHMNKNLYGDNNSDRIMFLYANYAGAIPLGMSDELDRMRTERFLNFCRTVAGAGPEGERSVELGERARSVIGSGLLEWIHKTGYASAPTAFLENYMKITRRLIADRWNDIDPTLRQRLEAHGIDSEARILNALDRAGNENLARRLEFILLNSRGVPGYIISRPLIYDALEHPQKAYYAKGAAKNLLHVRMHEIAEGAPGYDEFWGITRPALDTTELRLTAAYFDRMMDAVRATEPFKFAVTHEQLSELLGITPNDFIGVFERPHMNYSWPKGSTEPEPTRGEAALRHHLGVSFLEDWRTIDRERRGAAAEQRRLAALETAARQRLINENAKAQQDPWKDIAPALAEAIRAKFASPENLAAAVIEDLRAQSPAIAGRESAVTAEVIKALKSSAGGVNADGNGLEIIYARILQAMAPHDRNVAKVIFDTRRRPQGVDVFKHAVQSNIVTLAVQNPRLAAIFNWRLLKQAYSAASVSDLLDNLHTAYQPRAQREAQPTLLPSRPLLGIVEALNTGLEEAQKCQPDQIVRVDTWRDAARARTGRDPLPGFAASTNYILALN